MKMEDKYSNEADDHLSDLLKIIDLQKPSDQFVDRVVNTYSLQKDQKNFRLIKIPLFLMGSLSLFLFLPWVMSLKGIISDNPPPKLLDLIQGLSLDFSLWYLVCPIGLLLSLIAIVLIEMRSIAFYNKNTSVT